MNKQTKIIVGVAAVAAIIYLVKKAKDKKEESVKSDFNRLRLPSIIVAPRVKEGPGNTNMYRCLDGEGKTIYQRTPCNK